MFLLEQKEFAAFEKISREKNKNKFWRFVNKSKKKRTVSKEVSIPPDKLLEHYRNFFHDDQKNFTDSQLLIIDEVKSKFENFSTPKDIPFFKLATLKKLLMILNYLM